MRLYQDRLGALGWPCLVPEPAEMERLVAPAIAAVKAGQLAAARTPLAEAAARLAERGAAAVVLGCTEIPLALSVEEGAPLIDTIDALARAAVAWAREEVGAREEG